MSNHTVIQALELENIDRRRVQGNAFVSFDEANCELSFDSNHLGSLHFSGKDLIDCLSQLREVVEPDGWRVLCNGARADASVSQEVLEKFRGLKVFLSRPYEPRNVNVNLYDTLDHTIIQHVGTLAEQSSYNAIYLQSMGEI